MSVRNIGSSSTINIFFPAIGCRLCSANHFVPMIIVADFSNQGAMVRQVYRPKTPSQAAKGGYLPVIGNEPIIIDGIFDKRHEIGVQRHCCFWPLTDRSKGE